MSRPGQLAHGRPPGSMLTQIADRFREVDRRLREITAMATKAINAATAVLVVPTTAWVDDESATIDTTFGSFVSTSIAVPAGYTSGHLTVWVSAGITWATGTGNVTVQPVVWYGSPDAVGGFPINSGNSTISVSSSYFAYNFSGVGAGTAHPTIDLQMRAARSTGTVSGSANAHLAASVIFTR